MLSHAVPVTVKAQLTSVFQTIRITRFFNVPKPVSYLPYSDFTPLKSKIPAELFIQVFLL
jgi:hypothetical protein